MTLEERVRRLEDAVALAAEAIDEAESSVPIHWPLVRELRDFARQVYEERAAEERTP